LIDNIKYMCKITLYRRLCSSFFSGGVHKNFFILVVITHAASQRVKWTAISALTLQMG